MATGFILADIFTYNLNIDTDIFELRCSMVTAKPSGLCIFQGVFSNVKYFCRKIKESEWLYWLTVWSHELVKWQNIWSTQCCLSVGWERNYLAPLKRSPALKTDEGNMTACRHQLGAALRLSDILKHVFSWSLWSLLFIRNANHVMSITPHTRSQSALWTDLLAEDYILYPHFFREVHQRSNVTLSKNIQQLRYCLDGDQSQLWEANN